MSDSAIELDPNRALVELAADWAESLSLVNIGKHSAAEILPYVHAAEALPDDDPRREKLYWLLLGEWEASEDRDFRAAERVTGRRSWRIV